MNLDDIKDILELVREHDLAEFELERDGLKVRIRKAGHGTTMYVPSGPIAAAPPLATTGPVAALVPATADDPDASLGSVEGVELAVIKSPLVGTFYASSDPGARPFAQVGDIVKKDQVLCIVEAMKLMNEIQSETAGEIAAVYVENGQAVQFGDRLFAIKVA